VTNRLRRGRQWTVHTVKVLVCVRILQVRLPHTACLCLADCLFSGFTNSSPDVLAFNNLPGYASTCLTTYTAFVCCAWGVLFRLLFLSVPLFPISPPSLPYILCLAIPPDSPTLLVLCVPLRLVCLFTLPPPPPFLPLTTSVLAYTLGGRVCGRPATRATLANTRIHTALSVVIGWRPPS